MTAPDYAALDPRVRRCLRLLEGCANAGPQLADQHRTACYEALRAAGYPLGQPIPGEAP